LSRLIWRKSYTLMHGCQRSAIRTQLCIFRVPDAVQRAMSA
jgi:hypothetical protein